MGIKYSRHVCPRDLDELKEKVRKLEAEKVIVAPEHAKKNARRSVKKG